MNNSHIDPTCDLNNPASIPASNAGQTQGGPADAGEVKREALHFLMPSELEVWDMVVSVLDRTPAKDAPRIVSLFRRLKVALMGMNELRGEKLEAFRDIQTQLEAFDNAEDTNGELAAVRAIKAIVGKHV